MRAQNRLIWTYTIFNSMYFIQNVQRDAQMDDVA